MATQKFCSECGFKFEREFKFCPECGTRVSGKSTSNKKNQNTSVQEHGSKNLNPKVLYGILLGGLAVAAIIIFSSGILDSAPSQVSQMQGQTDISSGVNLNNMQAINDLETKIKNNPNDYESLLELAHLKNDSGLFEAAIINYKTYLEKYPDNPDARVDMGVCYFNLKDFPRAINEMETALKSAPDHQIAMLNLGVINLSAGNLEESKKWLKRAYDLNPTNEVGIKAEQLLKNH